jgi:hypothetical protein
MKGRRIGLAGRHTNEERVGFLDKWAFYARKSQSPFDEPPIISLAYTLRENPWSE